MVKTSTHNSASPFGQLLCPNRFKKNWDHQQMASFYRSTIAKGLKQFDNAQRGLIANPATGLLVYQIDGVTGYYFYTGVVWQLLNTSDAATSATGKIQLAGDLAGTATLKPKLQKSIFLLQYNPSDSEPPSQPL